MRKYVIEIDNSNVYLNGELRRYSANMCKENSEDDLNMKAILSLADEMGYEAAFLFEEMAQRLMEMLDE